LVFDGIWAYSECLLDLFPIFSYSFLSFYVVWAYNEGSLSLCPIFMLFVALFIRFGQITHEGIVLFPKLPGFLSFLGNLTKSSAPLPNSTHFRDILGKQLVPNPYFAQ